MNSYMENKLAETYDEEIEKALLALIEHEINTMIDGSDLAVELAVEIEDTNRYAPPAIWAWDDADTALEHMDPSDIIDAVMTGDCDGCKYWRRINPETNQIESYDNGREVIGKALEIIRENLGYYMYYSSAKEIILDMLGLELDDLCAELGIAEDIEPENITVNLISGKAFDIDDGSPESEAVWARIVDEMYTSVKEDIESVYPVFDDWARIDILAEYLAHDIGLPNRLNNIHDGIIITIDQ